MNRATKMVTIVLAISICVGGAILAAKQNPEETQRTKTRVLPINNRQEYDNGWLRAHNSHRSFHLSGSLQPNYRYVGNDAPLKLSLNKIESILRGDLMTKELFSLGKMEFGSVTVQEGAVVAEIQFRDNLVTEEFLCVLKHRSDGWYVAKIFPPVIPRKRDSVRA